MKNFRKRKASTVSLVPYYMPCVEMLEEIFNTSSAAISKCELSDSYFLSYKGNDISFKLCDLYAFKKKMMSIDLVELLDSSSPDVEIIHLRHCQRFLVLSIPEILEFRKLLNGTFDILALNSSIQKILRNRVFNF